MNSRLPVAPSVDRIGRPGPRGVPSSAHTKRAVLPHPAVLLALATLAIVAQHVIEGLLR